MVESKLVEVTCSTKSIPAAPLTAVDEFTRLTCLGSHNKPQLFISDLLSS